jgi:hypothetical protein
VLSPRSKDGNSQRRWILMVWLLTIGGCFVMSLASIDASATTIYSYIDEQGTPVMTDNFNTIPERYRARVKTTEQVATASQRTSTVGTIHERVSNFGRQLRDMVSGTAPNISGLSFTVGDSDLCWIGRGGAARCHERDERPIYPPSGFGVFDHARACHASVDVRVG